MEKQGNPENIMEETGKQNKIILSTEGVFMNSNALFIEYLDVIKSPMYIFLKMINHSKGRGGLDEIFDMSELDGKSDDELYEWYIERDEQNIFKSFDMNEECRNDIFHNDESVIDAFCYEMEQKEMLDIPELVSQDAWLNFDLVLRNLIGDKNNTGMVKKVYIWHPYYVESIEKDIHERYGGFVQFVYGDIQDVLIKNQVTSDTTFVFSNILHVIDLIQTNLINYSSIIIADEYFYNYNDEMEPIINFEELFKNYIFKIDFFNNIYTDD